MSKVIKLLDLCCGAGGAAMGYFQGAKDQGIEIQITGIDIKPQPNYPFTFIQDDAVSFLKKNHKKFTHFHSSPPCQKYSPSTDRYRKNGKIYPDNLEEIRELMYGCGKPGIIENVMTSPLRPDIILRGDMFDLKVLRSRKFELVNWFDFRPGTPKRNGTVRRGDYISVFGKAALRKNSSDEWPKFKQESILKTWSFAMGIDWMKTDRELAESIPPAYTRYLSLNFFKA